MSEPYWSGDAVDLYHGDCVSVMGGLEVESVDAVVTSPPYAQQRSSTYGGVSESAYPDFTLRWMRALIPLLKPAGSVVINIRPHVKDGQISDYTLRTRLALRESGWREVDELIWFKRSAPPLGSVNRPRRSWESLHWFALGKPWCDPKANGEDSTRVGMKGGRAVRLGWDHVSAAPDKIDQPIVTHPATYPPALAEWIIKLVCPPGGTVLDPFNGSGSTGIAARNAGMRYVGIDSVQEYVEMSAVRLAAHA
jgi:site-specific DNA-methyltransferase (adenine-specific)